MHNQIHAKNDTNKHLQMLKTNYGTNKLKAEKNILIQS